MTPYKSATITFLAILLGATAANASATVTSKIAGGVGAAVTGAIGVNAASISAPTTLNAGIGGGPLNGNVNGSSATMFGASASSNRAMLNGTSNGTLTTTATVRRVGSGTLTLSNAAGATMTLNLPQSVLSRLSLAPGNTVAMTRTARGTLLTNVTYLRSLTGRGTIRSVGTRSITYANDTGTHTLAFARSVASQLRLRTGSRIVVRALGMTRVQVTTLVSRRTRP